MLLCLRHHMANTPVGTQGSCAHIIYTPIGVSSAFTLFLGTPDGGTSVPFDGMRASFPLPKQIFPEMQ